jgi:site-specific DNA recombinase
MRTAIIYTRVSTVEQGNGYSPSRQKEVLEYYCKINEIKIVAHFDDQHSGKDFNRPEYQKLLAYLKHHKGITDLLFVRWDRFSRSVRHALNMIDFLEKDKISTNACEQPINWSIPVQRMMLNIYLSTGEVENVVRAQNIKNGQRKAISEGRWVSKAPIGYNNTTDNSNRKKLLVPNSHAPLVREAFEMMATGEYAQSEVIERINTNGVRWTKSHFARMLRHPVYCGYLILPATQSEVATLIKGVHEAIISIELFNKVLDVINGRADRKVREKKNVGNPAFHLKGVLICGQCGNFLRAYFSLGKMKNKKYGYYECKVCNKERIKLEIANNAIIDFLTGMFMTREAKHEYIKVIEQLLKGSENDISIKKGVLEKRLGTLYSNLDKVDKDYSIGVIASDDYRRVTTRMKEEIENIREEKKTLEKAIPSIIKYWRFGMK